MTIGNSVKSIGNDAFYNCSSLKKMEVKAKTPPTCSDDTEFKFNVTLYVPKKSVELYKRTEPWSKLGSIIGVDF
jgi:hypothetical protein